MDLQFTHIYKSYGDHCVLRDFSHCFAEGKISCITGASGCGKTTLLRLASGLEAPDEGVISGFEHKKISAVFQENRLLENLSAEKNILLTARRGFNRQDARKLLAELHLEDCAKKRVCEFSGGMKRRTALARALAADYSLLLLDEPLSGLDAAARALVLSVILRHAANRTVLCATHDLQAVDALNADVLCL